MSLYIQQFVCVYGFVQRMVYKELRPLFIRPRSKEWIVAALFPVLFSIFPCVYKVYPSAQMIQHVTQSEFILRIFNGSCQCRVFHHAGKSIGVCRVSCDVSLDWDDKPHMRLIHRERVSTRQAILTSLFRRQLNGRAFLSDPDVFFLREDNVKLSPQQKKLLADCCSLFGGMLLCSDDMAQYTPEALAQYRQMLKNRQAENIRVLAAPFA